jgi:hypothetical protein
MPTSSKTYIQGGVEFMGGKKTKGRLKELIGLNPASVYLYDTSASGSKFNGTVDKLPVGIVFNVIGPDPYSKRDWYASIERDRFGTIRVK